MILMMMMMMMLAYKYKVFREGNRPERAKALGTKGTLAAMIKITVMTVMMIDDNGDGVGDEADICSDDGDFGVL